MKKKSSLDQAAEKLIARANKISKGNVGAPAVVPISACTDDDIIGTYPQAAPVKAKWDFIDDGYLYFDRFPEPAKTPIELRLAKGAKWTDVLSASIRFRCLLVNAKALAVFKQFNLGRVRYYEATVADKKGKQQYTYIFVCNHVTLDDIDFARSECFLVDMLSDPLGKLKIKDKADYEKKSKGARDGTLPGSERFCKINLGKIQVRAGQAPKCDIFGVTHIDSRLYVSTSLRDALQDADVSGLEFGENDRLFF